MAQRKKASIKPKASPPPKIRPSYILIVEDEPTQAAVVRRTIRTANPNVKVKVASSLQEYRNALLNSKPEIVLMDINLPDGKAFEVLTSPVEAGLFPIVVMTGYGNEKIAVKAMKQGALDYVVKSPEAFKAIPRTIERALREWKLIQERKRTEEALHESELRFYALYENVTIGLYRTTPAGKILMANRALVKMLGYSSFEKLAERNLAKVGFEKLSQRTAFLRKIETEGEVNNFESVWIRQDGSLLIVQESARAIRDSFGKTLYYDGAAEDITERRLAEVGGRHAEDALRESEEKFRSIAENFHDILFITDTKGIITYISPAVDHVFGYKSEDMKGRFFGEYLDEVELPRIKPVFERAIRTGIPTKNLSVCAKRRDGKIFYAELDTSIVEKNGKVQGTTGVIRDISERKRAEETIRESEDIFRNFMEHSPIFVFFKDENIRAIRLSKNYEAMLGKPVAELLGKNMNDLFPSELAMSIVADDKRIMKEGKEITIEEELNGRYYSTLKFPIFIEGKPRYLAGFTIDITERKQAEEALQQSKAQLTAFMNFVPALILIKDHEFRILFANENYSSLFPINDWMGKKPGEVFPPDVAAHMIQKDTEAMEKGYTNYEEIWLDKEGKQHIFYTQKFKITIPNGQPLLGAIISDITERKKAEEALRESEDKFKYIFDHSPVGKSITLTSGEINVNMAFCEMLGYTQEELRINKWQDITHPADVELTQREIDRLLSGEQESARFVKRFLHKNGAVVWVDMSTFLRNDNHGKPLYLISTVIDITERKRAEELIVRALQEWQNTFDSTNDAMWILDKNERIIRSNRTSEFIFQRSNEDLIGKHCWEIVYGTTQPIPECPVQRAKKSLHRASLELQIGKGWFEVLVDPILDARGQYDGAVHIVSNISERKQAAEALSASEEKYRLLFENNPVPMWVFDVNSLAFLAVNDFAIDHYGYSREEFLSMTIKDIRPPEDISYLQEVLDKHTEQLRKVGTARHRRKDGSLIDVEITGHEIEFEGHRAMFVLALDITERKRAEEALRNSEEKFRKAFITSPDSININRLNDGVYVSINQGLTRLMGYTEEDILGKTSIEINIWVDLSDRNKLLEGLKKDGVVENLVARFRSKTGEIKYGMMSASIIVLDGIQHILSITRDITERKQAEEELTQSRDLLANLSRLVPGVVYQYRLYPDGRSAFPYSSPGMNDIYEVTPEEVREDATPVFGRLHPDDYDNVANAIQESARTLDEFYSEFRVNLPRQGLRWRWCQAHPERLADGGTLWHGIISDITERKLAEEALRESEERFSILSDASFEGIVITEKSRIIDVNEQMAVMYGYERSEMIGLTVDQFVAPESMELVLQHVKSGSEDPYEHLSLRKDGSTFPVEIRAKSLPYKGRIVRVTAIRDITERKRTEEAMRRYQLLSQNTRDIILFLRVNDLQIVEANDAAVQAYGYDRKELMNISIHDLRAPETLNDIPKQFQEANLKGLSFETLHRRRDGTEFPVEVNSQGIAMGNERILLSVIRDITERKRAEEALRESESQFRELWGATVEGIVILDKGIIIEVNEAMCQMFGYTRDHAIGKSMLEFAPIEMHDRLRERIASGIEGRFETPALRADGTRMMLEIFAKRIIYKGKSVRMVATRDITERTRAEEALRESEERMRAIVEGTPHLFFYTQDVDANTTYVSPTVEQITGYKADIWLKRKDWFVTAAKINQYAKEKTLAHLRGEFSNEPILLEVCHANGNSIFLEAYEYPILQKGKLIGLQGVAHDITERRQAEDTLRQMQKLEGLGTLAGGIAHDFNNILGIILAYNANIKRHKDDAKQLNLATDTITKAVERGSTLVSQILTFARRSGTEFGPVNVTEVVMEIVTMIIETFPKILTYSQNFDKNIPIINADRSQLHQALLNLCVNARDVMPNGGVLTINTRMVSGTSLRNLHPDPLESSYVCIEVIDTGEGMTDEIRKRIFEPFFTTKEKGKGTGLGLAVVFGIVQTHKGFIDVESELGKGTTFRMYIPASQAAAPISLEVGETIEELPGGKETLLVVEDELNLRIPLLKILREKGYTVLSAENGLEGAKIYEKRNNDIALVITDLGLPKMSGMDLCKRIKQLNPGARIVVATGYLAPEIKLEFQKAGIQNILYKPYNARKVLKAVREVLDEK